MGFTQDPKLQIVLIILRRVPTRFNQIVWFYFLALGTESGLGVNPSSNLCIRQDEYVCVIPKQCQFYLYFY